MPMSRCFLTTPATAEASVAAWVASAALPSARARNDASSSAGRDRLPTWVVRMRLSLRFMGCSLAIRPALANLRNSSSPL